MKSKHLEQAFNKVMTYFHDKNIPVKLIYNDGTEQTVKIITFDNYHIFCKGFDEGRESFIVPKHSIKRINTEVNLEKVIEKVKN